MEKGVKVYEEPYKYLHMKVYSVDDQYFNIGSFNQDVTSFFCNNEANLLVSTTQPNQIKSIMPFFNSFFSNLKKECVPVNPYEKYTWGNYLKTRFWNLWVEGTYFTMHNRNR